MGAGFEPCALCLLVDPSRFACRFRPRPLGSVAAFGDEWEPPHPLAEGNHPPGAHLVPYPATRCIALRAIPEAGKPHACFACPYLPLRRHERPRNTPRTVSPNQQPQGGLTLASSTRPPDRSGLHRLRRVKVTWCASCISGGLSKAPTHPHPGTAAAHPRPHCLPLAHRPRPLERGRGVVYSAYT